MKKSGTIKILLCVFVLIFMTSLLAGCKTSAAETTAAATTAAAETTAAETTAAATTAAGIEFPAEIVIGISTALSGGWAGFGVKPATGAEIAVEHINETGGIKSLGGAKLRLAKGDDQGVPERAIAEAERLINNENVVSLIGVWPTETPMAATCERYSVPGVFPLGVGNTQGLGYKYVFKPYTTGAIEAAQQMNAILEGAKANNIEPPKSVYMAYISDDASVTNAAGFRDQCAANGVEILGDEIIPSGQPSYASVLSKIERAKPELLYLCLYTPDSIVIYKEIMERKLYFPYGITGWGGGIEDIGYFNGVAPEAYAYEFSQENGDPLPWRRPYYDYINSRVEEKIGTSWTDSHFVSTYSAVWIIKDALERVVYSADLATFRTNLRDALKTTDITLENGEKIPIPGTDLTFIPALQPFGNKWVKFDETGLNTWPAGSISQVIDGVRWPISPLELQEPDGPKFAVLPIPTWEERQGSPKLITTVEELNKLLSTKKY